MPTQIIDGFKLNAATPIDTRIVAANAAQRNNIQHKYEGLRVFDLTDKAGYVWLDGQWKEEGTTSTTGAVGGGGFGGGGGAGGAGGGFGTLDRIPKFGATGLTNSIITEQLKNGQYYVGIGKQQTTYKLEVDGSLKATTLIGSIDGGNVVTDTLPLDRLKKPTAVGNYILKYDGSGVVWAAESAAANVGVTNTTTPTDTHYLLFSDSSQSSSTTLRANFHTTTKLLGFKPDSAQILGSTQEDPVYSFVGQTNTGFYGTNTEVGVKISNMKVFNSLASETNIGILTTSSGVALVNSIKMTTTNVNIAQQTTIKNYIKFDISGNVPFIEFSAPKFTFVNPNGQRVERLGVFDLQYANSGGSLYAGFTNLRTTHNLRMLLKSAGTEYVGLQVIMGPGESTKNVRIASTLGTTTAAAGMILQSTDANGTLGWMSLPTSVPYGTIIIWHRGRATIPSGWAECNGVGYIYLNEENAYGTTTLTYVAVPNYRDRGVFGLPTGSTEMNTDYGTLSPRTVNHEFTLVTGQIPAHVHWSQLPKHRHYMKGGTDTESSSTEITASGAHFHGIRKAGGGTGDARGFDGGSADNDSIATEFFGEKVTDAPNHTHGKTTFEGYTSFRVYTNAGAEGVYFNTGPTSYWEDLDKPYVGKNVDGGGLANSKIQIPQKRMTTVLFLIKYNPTATQNQEGHYSSSSTGAGPAPAPSPTPSPGGGLQPVFPGGGAGVEYQPNAGATPAPGGFSPNLNN